MKEEILKRAMFAMPLSKEAQNSGILSGFMDSEDDTEEQASPEDQSLEELPVMARTPQNPEILMNNLRGDMRSLDARYVELAQMVGEQAAMETPPEVLAMLMGQLGQQAGGIGALPQGQAMTPPPMPGEAPAPGGQPMPPQQPPMMPPGMEGMGGPFPSGGAEQAPPQQFADGGEARSFMDRVRDFSNYRGVPEVIDPQTGRFRGITEEDLRSMAFQPAIGGMISPVQGMSRAAAGVGEVAGAANRAAGAALFPQSVPVLQRMVGPGGAAVTQAQNTLRMLPTGEVAAGTGTKIAPWVTGAGFRAPSLTEGVTQGVRQAMQNPVVDAAARVGIPGGAILGGTAYLANQGDQEPAGGYYTPSDLVRQIPDQEGRREVMPPSAAGAGRGMINPPMALAEPQPEYPPTGVIKDEANYEALIQNLAKPDAEAAPAAEKEDTAAFIDRVVAQAKSKTKGERIKERYEELSPLYKEILGDDADARRQQALLLLAEAGFKFAGTAAPTMGVALAKSLSGVPVGLSALAAQKAEREAKVKGAALSQAVEDVGAEDTAQRALQLQILKGDYDLLKAQAGKGGAKLTDGGAGLRVLETKEGSFQGYSIDPNDPTVTRAVTSRYTLTPASPFVTNLGQAPQAPETDKGERIKLTGTLRDLDDTLSLIETAKKNLAGAYGAGAWYSSFENNMLVPVTPLSPNVADEKAKSTINLSLNRIKGNLARVNNSGRVSVQEQQWIDEVLPARAGQFFQDAEVNAARFNALQALVQNQRQQVLAQLGYVGDNLVMEAPSTGTKNDPFVIPADPAQQQNMFSFLGGTVGTVSNPNALVYLRLPDGSTRAFRASELRGQQKE